MLIKGIRPDRFVICGKRNLSGLMEGLHYSQMIYYKAQLPTTKGNARIWFLKIYLYSCDPKPCASLYSCHFDFSLRKFMNNAGEEENAFSDKNYYIRKVIRFKQKVFEIC